MKSIRVYVICIDIYVSSSFSYFSDSIYDCVVLGFQHAKNKRKNKSSVVMLFSTFALHLQHMSQGHHCSPLLKCRLKLQMVNSLCTYWRTSNFVDVYVTLWKHL